MKKTTSQSPQTEKQKNIEHLQLLNIFNKLDQPIYISDPQTYERLFANNAYKEIWGNTAGEQVHQVMQGSNTPCSFFTNNHFWDRVDKQSCVRKYQDGNNVRFFHCMDRAITWPNNKTVRFELATEITSLKKIENKYKESENRFRTLMESTPAVIWIVDKENFLYINPAGIEFTGYREKELYSMNPVDIVHPDMRTLTLQREQAMLKGNKNSQQHDIKVIDRNGAIKWLTYAASLINYHGETAILGSGFDITSRKTAENALIKKKKKLIEQAKHLAELNTALKVLIEHRDEKIHRLEDNIQATIKKLIFPYLEELEHSKLTEKSKTVLKTIRSNLKEVISPFINTLQHNSLPLTPMEIQVADLIKLGKSNKEIASFMNVSLDTVSFHRKNIRKKLNLTHSKINLRTYLLSLS